MEIYKDKNKPVEERVRDLLSRMTAEEKVGQMVQLPAKRGIVQENFIDKLEEWHVGSFLHCTGDTMAKIQERAAKTRLGIPVIFGIDAIHGHCFDDDGTVFPTQLAMSCSWEPELLRRAARVTAREVRADGIHWTFSPVLCVGRDTRWGRVDETFGEDTWLIGVLGTAMVKGYQGDDLSGEDSILACVKHFVAYGEATGGRDAYEAEVSKRKLLSLFLPPFEKAVKEGGAATVMTAYEAIDGVPATVNSWLLRKTLKEDWGFYGFVVTDWDNVGALTRRQAVAVDGKQAALDAIKAGNDMSMTTPDFYPNAVELYREGKLTDADLDDAAGRILRLKFRLGLFDERRFTDPSARRTVVGAPEHWDVALGASRKSLTLLVNNGTLPLRETKNRRILVVGPNADDIRAQLGDWSFGSMQAGAVDSDFHRKDTVTVLGALQNAATSKGYSVDYVKGADCLDDSFDEIPAALEAARKADYVVACVGDTIELHGEGRDRSELDLTGKQLELLKALRPVAKRLIVVFIASKPLALGWVKDHADALLCGFNPGAKGGVAIKEALFGELNPSGRLTISFPRSAGQLPVHYDRYRGWHSMNPGGVERYIDSTEDPVFSFGEGLSYTKFEYSALEVLTPRVAPGDSPAFRVTVKNTGVMAGTETVQLYVRDLVSSVTTPCKNLRSFAKVDLAPGQTANVRLEVAYDDLALVTPDLKRVVEPGEFEVMVGHSSRDEDLLVGRFWVTA